LRTVVIAHTFIAASNASSPKGSPPAVIGRLNHIGVATPSIDDSLRFYRDVLGVTAVTGKARLA
jgi:hypothetical protein